MYKQLSADVYEKIGLEAERAIDELCGKMLPQIPSIFEIKGHYLGKHDGLFHGRHLSNFANTLIIILYIVVATAPIWKGTLSEGTLTLKLDNLLPVSILLLFIGSGKYVYSSSKKKIYTQIEEEWKTLKGKINTGIAN